MNNLVKNSYYKITNEHYSNYYWYCKFLDYYNDKHIIIDGYGFNNNENRIFYLDEYSTSDEDEFVKVEFSEIVDKYPDDDINKIFYLRNKKINYLLCN